MIYQYLVLLTTATYDQPIEVRCGLAEQFVVLLMEALAIVYLAEEYVEDRSSVRQVSNSSQHSRNSRGIHSLEARS